MTSTSTTFTRRGRMNSFLKKVGCYGTVVLAAATLLPLVARGQAPASFGALPNARQIEWYHRERQVLLHFNMNTFTNSEWSDGTTPASTFNPTALDCGQWVRTVKQAGFTCAILVAKHQDGFCLWPSAYTTYSVASSPYKGGKGDIVKEFTDSCRAYGVKPGIYLSYADLHFMIVLNNTVAAYQTYFMNQLLEICKNYGTIWEVWWDGANNGLPASAFQTFADTIHKLQPNCVIWSDAPGKNQTAESRWIGNEQGNAGDPCWPTMDTNWSNEGNGTLGGTIYSPAEVSSSDRPGWFWHQNENNSVQTVNVMWNKYFQSVGRNGVWLYNLPPDNRGLDCFNGFHACR
jgi:alpha-L-fucosidase